MFVRNVSKAPEATREGIISKVLLENGAIQDTELTVTWVQVDPGHSQEPHQHASEQVYVIVRGKGRMHVDDEDRDVKVGDLIHIPSGTNHYIDNQLAEPLTYVSATTPPINVQPYYPD